MDTCEGNIGKKFTSINMEIKMLSLHQKFRLFIFQINLQIFVGIFTLDITKSSTSHITSNMISSFHSYFNQVGVEQKLSLAETDSIFYFPFNKSELPTILGKNSIQSKFNSLTNRISLLERKCFKHLHFTL